MTKTKLPEITVDDWLAAEAMLKRPRVPQPPNTVTVDQYSRDMDISLSRAHHRLYSLFKAGLATRQKWNRVYIYSLKR